MQGAPCNAAPQKLNLPVLRNQNFWFC
jgi:hypothetical protein